MDYLKGATIIESAKIHSGISAVNCLSAARVTLHDDAFFDLNGKLRYFLQQIRDERPMAEYKVDRHDCDKFVRIMLGRIAEHQDDFPESIFAAWMNHWPKNGDYHAAILVLDAGRLWYYEPQRKEVELVPVETVVREAVEIWG